jgi:type VI secretion system secreted protein Hcp
MAYDAFMQVKGIDGESQDDGHKNWIEILHFEFAAHQPAGGSRSSSGAASGERVNVSDVSISKLVDKASPKLFLACCNGEHIPEVTIHLCRAGKDKVKYLEYKLSDVIISSYAPSGAAGGGDPVPTEQLTFNPGKLEVVYTATDPKTGKTAGDVKAHWDLVANKGG